MMITALFLGDPIQKEKKNQNRKPKKKKPEVVSLPLVFEQSLLQFHQTPKAEGDENNPQQHSPNDDPKVIHALWKKELRKNPF